MFRFTKKTNIELTHGDSAYITFAVTDDLGNKITLGEHDVVRCQVRRQPNGGELLIDSELTEDEHDGIVWHIRPEDTEDLPVGEYYYDAQVEFKDSGDIFSFIPVSKFILIDEVTEAVEGE